VILEADLDDLIAEAEHDGMLGPHPFLDIYNLSATTIIFPHLGIWVNHIGRLAARRTIDAISILVLVLLRIVLEIRSEMLEKGHLLLKFLGEV
jgi:hypothetical protein